MKNAIARSMQRPMKIEPLLPSKKVASGCFGTVGNKPCGSSLSACGRSFAVSGMAGKATVTVVSWAAI